MPDLKIFLVEHDAIEAMDIKRTLEVLEATKYPKTLSMVLFLSQIWLMKDLEDL